MSLFRHLRWLFPLIMFIAIVALIVGLVVGLPISTVPHLADDTDGKNNDYNFFFFL